MGVNARRALQARGTHRGSRAMLMLGLHPHRLASPALYMARVSLPMRSPTAAHRERLKAWPIVQAAGYTVFPPAASMSYV